MHALETAIDAAPAHEQDPDASSPLHDVDCLLRDRAGILERIAAGRDLGALARAMIMTIFFAGAAFGAAVGAYRGGIQIAYAALKMPLVILLTAAVCAPALTAFNAALDRRASLRRDLALVLAALALGSLVIAAEAPLVLLAANYHADYHTSTLLVVGCCLVGGLAGLALLVRGLAQDRRRVGAATLAFLGVFLAVGSQMAWTLRPYLVRPRATEVPIVRGIDSSLFESVRSSLDSSMGVYHREEAPLPASPASGDK